MSNISLNSKIFKSRNIILNLLQRRGFNTSGYDDFSVHEIHILDRNEQLDIFIENPDTGKKCYVKYHLNGKLTKSNVYDYIEDLYNIENILSDEDDLIIIIKDNFNDTMKDFIKNIYYKDKKFLCVYEINRYLFNILDHIQVPMHIPLSLEEKEKLEKVLKVQNSNQWPEIGRFDPVAQAIGLRPNQLCKILRKSQTAGITEFYRLCI